MTTFVDEIEDPVAGQRWVFHTIEHDVLEADLFVSPGGFVRSHVHPRQEETFLGVAGTFVLDVDGQTKTIGPGDTLVIPQGTPHGFSAAAEAAQLRVTVRPGLELDRFFRAQLGLSKQGKLSMPAEGNPKPLLLAAVLLHRYREEIAAPGIPVWLQRPLWWALALVGRLTGHRAAYPELGAP